MTQAKISSQTDEVQGNRIGSNSISQPASQTAKLSAPFHPVVATYFAALNAGDYLTVSHLFAAESTLLPPFESAILGPEAIRQYLSREAKGMTALPQSEIQQPEAEELNIQVLGQVQTALFSVNVSWQLRLNAEAEIIYLKIKLLATLRDLLHLKPEGR